MPLVYRLGQVLLKNDYFLVKWTDFILDFSQKYLLLK